MISVEDARAQLLELVTTLDVERVPLRRAAGRVLARDVVATRTQPPFAASSMDGYAVRRAEVEPDAMFKVVGEAAAGHRFEGDLRAGQAVRIFTGAPVPKGADFVVIQEDVTRRGDLITLGHRIGDKDNIRPAGGDFEAGQVMKAPLVLRPADIALLAAMNIADVPVTRRPRVAIMATGDELVQPGEAPGPDQIIASNSYGLAAMFEGIGAQVQMLPIARDTTASLKQAFTLAKDADLIITIGKVLDFSTGFARSPALAEDVPVIAVDPDTDALARAETLCGDRLIQRALADANEAVSALTETASPMLCATWMFQPSHPTAPQTGKMPSVVDIPTATKRSCT